MCDVLGVGANSVDFVYRLPDTPRPDSVWAKMPITGHVVSCGGQVTTALSTCAALGLRVAYVGTTGTDDNGRRMRDALAGRGIDTTHAVVREGPNPYAVILIDDQHGERIVLWRRSPAAALTPADIPLDAIRAARLVHVDDVDVEASLEAARLARHHGVPVTSDIEQATDAGRALLDAVTIPILAEHVPSALTGEADVARALAALRRPHHTMLCVTQGARGAALLHGNDLHSAPGIRVTAVDTTGAGDVFRGAFICALLRGDGPAGIVRFANRAAALSCTRLGAMDSVPTRAEMEGRL